MSVLLRLTIERFGLIERAEVAFADAFTVFTGETGSGKSMLLGALEAALGGRVERDQVRGERTRITLELVPDDALRAALAEAGIALAPDDDVAIVREVTSAGRSSARINGVAVSTSQLRGFGAFVAETIGQGEAGGLLEPAFAREALDAFGGEPVRALRDRLHVAFGERASARRERDALTAGTARAAADRDIARFAVDEIDAAAIEADEDVRLRERRDVLAHAEQIAAGLAAARAALEDDSGAIDALGSAMHALAGLARYGAAFAPLAAGAAALQAEANDLAAALARAADDVERDPAALEAVMARLASIDALKRKYGGTLAAIAETRERAAALIAADAGRDERLVALERRIADLDATVAELAAALGAQRRAAAQSAQAGIADELHVLALPAARFTIAVEPLDEIAAHGGERVEFRFAANPGEPERPLARTASGGERSRVLLALVVALARDADARAFVFDEVDAGIGGATAVAVGARLQRLAAHAQVVCVTHLAQIAAHAQIHYALRKCDVDGVTTIEVVALPPGNERLEEIARMLSGETTGISLEHAAALVSATRGAP